MPDSSLPLARFKILDLTRVRSGPTCVKVLADWGADVLKIEMPPKPGQDDGYTGSRDSADFQNLHRKGLGFGLPGYIIRLGRPADQQPVSAPGPARCLV